MERQREWSHGEQRIWFEPPDILWTRYRGLHTGEVTEWYCGVYREVAATQRFYLAADVTGVVMTPESRRFLLGAVKLDWFHGLVYIGAGLEQKAATKSLMVGALLSSGQPLDLHYVDTPEQARAWIEQRRAARKDTK
jgi:hypothetical protein